MATPELPDVIDSFTIQDALERIHSTKIWHIVFSLLYGLAVTSFSLALIGIDFSDQGTPYTKWIHYAFAIPLISILGFGLMLHTWANNLSLGNRILWNVIGITWVLVITGIFIYFLFDRFLICPNDLPLYCTNGVSTKITGYYEWYFWSLFASWVFLIAELIVFNIIFRKIKLLLDPRTGMLPTEVLLAMTSRVPRYLNSIGADANRIGKRPAATFTRKNTNYKPKQTFVKVQ